ncbi:MAG: cell division protein ZapA [Brachymonas sp.]
MKQLEVQIMGKSYLLAAPEGGEQRLITAVEKVDTAMCKIRDAGKVKARDRIAVLAALNLAFETESMSQSLATQAAAPPLPSATISSQHAGTDARLTHLIAKLDQALLTTDGQLL